MSNAICNETVRVQDSMDRLSDLLSFISAECQYVIYYMFTIPFITIYVHKKCPYMVRLSGIICLLSWIAMLLPSHSFDSGAEQFPSASRLSVSYFALVHFLQSKATEIQRLFFTLLFIRIWWCKKTDIITGVTDSGFDHLEETARKMHINKGDAIKENFKMRDTSTYPPAFPNGWNMLLLSSELKNGETKPVFALGQCFAAFRGHNGKAYILDAFCPHLGANLSVGGKVIGNCLECPFHAWQFDGETGMCTRIPYSNKIPETGKIKSWPCSEENGFIYVWYHAENQPPSWHVPSLQETNKKQLYYAGRAEYYVRCHVQDIWENSIDSVHLKTVHGNMPEINLGFFHLKWGVFKNEWELTWEACSETAETHASILSLKWYLRAFGIPLRFITYTVSTKLVGTAGFQFQYQSFLGNAAIALSIVSEQPLQQRVVSLIYTELSVPQSVANIILLILRSLAFQDIGIVNNKKFLHQPTLIKGDGKVNLFRRWFSQFYSDNSPTVKDIQNQSTIW